MNKSNTRTVILKLLPVVGSIILFLAWVFQQTLLGDANGTLQRISAGESVFQTYQSNNALFNAILATSNSDSDTISKVRSVQVYNYNLGLNALEQLLTEAEKAGIPEQPNPFSGNLDADSKMAILQERIDSIQAKLDQRKADIIALKSRYNKIFISLYVLGTLTVLTGSLLNGIAQAGITSVNTQPKVKHA
jgi:hypothetical protein